MAQSIFPHLTVSDGAGALSFYEKAFGAKTEMKVPAEDGKRLMHASMTIHGGTVLLVDDFPEFGDGGGLKPPTRLSGTSVTIHIEVPDADAAFGRAVSAGATVVMPLDNQFWGARYGKLKDPFGHVWSIGGPLK
jgi:PhnB protein